MKIEQQVCSFEQAEKLFNLGLELKSIFHWMLNGNCNQDNKVYLWPGDDMPGQGYILKQYPAYTVAELDLLLNQSGYVCHYVNIEKYNINNGKHWWDLNAIYNDDLPIIDKSFSVEYGALAKAEALIFLIENGHVDVKGLAL